MAEPRSPLKLLEGFSRHGLRVIQGWGMTETSPIGTICQLPSELDKRAPGGSTDTLRAKVWRCRFSSCVQRSDDGELVPWDDRAMGELEVRGPGSWRLTIAARER